jgi:hypothetical protein
MAFCGSCGTALDNSSVFCPGCGAKAPQPAAQPAARAGNIPATSSAGPPAPTVTRSSSAMKIVLIVGMLGVCALGALAYAGYWAKNKIETTAAEQGITLPSGTSEHSRSHTSSHKSKEDPCSFVSKEEVSSAIGVEVVVAMVHDSTCSYTGSNPADVVVVEVNRGDAPIAMMAVKGSSKLMEMAPGTELQQLSGVGDEAYFQNGMVTVRKGDDFLRLVLPATLLIANFGEHMDMQANIVSMRDKGKTLANLVLPRM